MKQIKITKTLLRSDIRKCKKTKSLIEECAKKDDINVLDMCTLMCHIDFNFPFSKDAKNIKFWKRFLKSAKKYIAGTESTLKTELKLKENKQNDK